MFTQECFLRGCKRKVWSPLVWQGVPDPGVTTDHAKEKANVRCVINRGLITLFGRLGRGPAETVGDDSSYEFCSRYTDVAGVGWAHSQGMVSVDGVTAGRAGHGESTRLNLESEAHSRWGGSKEKRSQERGQRRETQEGSGSSQKPSWELQGKGLSW